MSKKNNEMNKKVNEIMKTDVYILFLMKQPLRMCCRRWLTEKQAVCLL